MCDFCFCSTFSVSHSTRKPHPEETAGKDYHFVTLDKFEMDIKMVNLEMA